MQTRPPAPTVSLSAIPARVGQAAAAYAGLAPRSARLVRVNRGAARFIGAELAIWATLYGLYLAVRGLTIGSQDTALGNARDVVAIERAIGLFHESGIQAALHSAADVFAVYYMLGFGPLLAAVLLWLALRQPAAYRELRTALFVSLAFATVVFVLFPTAPPRLVQGLGLTDTVGLASHDTGSFLGVRFNPYAAVPSMHVGWSLLLAASGFRMARSRVARSLFLLHPVVMTVTVTATGNHFLFDAAAGAAVASLTLWLMRLRSRRACLAPQRGAPALLRLAASSPVPLSHRPIELERNAA